MPDPTPTAAQVTEYLTPDEVADLLRVDRKTVYAAIRDGRLPALNVGGARPVFRVARRDLDRLTHSPDSGVPSGRHRRPRGDREFTNRVRGV